MMKRAYKYCFCPAPEQAGLLNRTSGSIRYRTPGRWPSAPGRGPRNSGGSPRGNLPDAHRVEERPGLDTLVQSGKVRYLAASNYAGWQLMKALAAADLHHYQRFAAQQIYYSLEARDAEYELVPLALDQGLGILVWSPLAGGLLSGKFRRDAAQPENSRHLSGWNEPPVRNEDRLYDTIEVLLDVAKAHGVPAAQVALAWLLGRPGVTSLVIGARTDEQLADNLAAADLLLSSDERAALDQVSAPDLIYPYWHQAQTASDRLSDPDLALLAPHLQK